MTLTDDEHELVDLARATIDANTDAGLSAPGGLISVFASDLLPYSFDYRAEQVCETTKSVSQ